MTRVKRTLRRAVALAELGAALWNRDIARALISIGDLRHG